MRTPGPRIRWAWAAALLLVAGAFLIRPGRQKAMPLRAPLAGAIRASLPGYQAQDISISAAELEVAGVSAYVFRVLRSDQGPGSASVYVGYYRNQVRGKTIHSPKNCLPGAGWEALASGTTTITTPGGPATVNRYLIRRGAEQAVVLYWYQGRGRLEWNEYKVKLDLLRDAALRGRTEEALVRVVVPITSNQETALATARELAGRVVAEVDTALPAA